VDEARTERKKQTNVVLSRSSYLRRGRIGEKSRPGYIYCTVDTAPPPISISISIFVIIIIPTASHHIVPTAA
jgi:hypothetical protein